MTKNYLEAGFVLKIAAATLFVAGAAKVGMAVADQADIFQANVNATVSLQKETPQQIAARTARIANDNKQTPENGIPGAILLLASGAAFLTDRIRSDSSSNPYDRRANRRIR